MNSTLETADMLGFPVRECVRYECGVFLFCFWGFFGGMVKHFFHGYLWIASGDHIK